MPKSMTFADSGLWPDGSMFAVMCATQFETDEVQEVRKEHGHMPVKTNLSWSSTDVCDEWQTKQEIKWFGKDQEKLTQTEWSCWQRRIARALWNRWSDCTQPVFNKWSTLKTGCSATERQKKHTDFHGLFQSVASRVQMCAVQFWVSWPTATQNLVRKACSHFTLRKVMKCNDSPLVSQCLSFASSCLNHQKWMTCVCSCFQSNDSSVEAADNKSHHMHLSLLSLGTNFQVVWEHSWRSQAMMFHNSNLDPLFQNSSRNMLLPLLARMGATQPAPLSHLDPWQETWRLAARGRFSSSKFIDVHLIFAEQDDLYTER